MGRVAKVLEGMVGAALLYSGLNHLVNPFQFAAMMAAYELLPLPSLQYLSIALAGVMVSLGVALLSDTCADAAIRMALLAFVVFTSAQLFAVVSGKEISCGCFGYSNQPISLTSISIPVVLGVFSFASLVMRSRSSNAFKPNQRVREEGRCGFGQAK